MKIKIPDDIRATASKMPKKNKLAKKEVIVEEKNEAYVAEYPLVEDAQLEKKLTKKEALLLDTIIRYIVEDVQKNHNIGDAMERAKKFIKKTSSYMEEEAIGTIFKDFSRKIRR